MKKILGLAMIALAAFTIIGTSCNYGATKLSDKDLIIQTCGQMAAKIDTIEDPFTDVSQYEELKSVSKVQINTTKPHYEIRAEYQKDQQNITMTVRVNEIGAKMEIIEINIYYRNNYTNKYTECVLEKQENDNEYKLLDFNKIFNNLSMQDMIEILNSIN